jgi:hypothetical protein
VEGRKKGSSSQFRPATPKSSALCSLEPPSPPRPGRSLRVYVSVSIPSKKLGLDFPWGARGGRGGGMCKLLSWLRPAPPALAPTPARTRIQTDEGKKRVGLLFKGIRRTAPEIAEIATNPVGDLQARVSIVVGHLAEPMAHHRSQTRSRGHWRQTRTSCAARGRL